MDKRTTIIAFKEQDERIIQDVYKGYRPKFLNWLKGQFRITEEADRLEIYQRSFTVLYMNIKRGKLDTLESTLETYLYGIGKMILKEWWREKKNEQQFSAFDTGKADDKSLIEELAGISLFPNSDKVDERLSEQLLAGLNKLGEPCQTILKLFYWERNSMEAIANKTGYKNEKGAKKKKYLCLQKLRELMK